MEVQQLTLHISEQDLNDLARKYLSPKFPIDNLKFEITSEGLTVSGNYPMFVTVQFDTSWELGVRDGKVTARLHKVKAMGLPVTVFKSMILEIIRKSASKLSWLSHETDLIVTDVDQLAREEGFSFIGNLNKIQCRLGSILVKAGRSAQRKIE